MEQRRPRLGDIVDDYCPRERRITNHAVVAMIEDEVKQTRCTTCDADHDYKQARIPAQRRKKPGASALDGQALPEGARGRVVAPDAADESQDVSAPDDGVTEVPVVESSDGQPDTPVLAASTEDVQSEEEPLDQRDDDGVVHRRLIRAQLPRPEGQVPERKAPDFTIRQQGQRGSRFDQNTNGNRPGQPRRTARGQYSPSGGGGGGGQQRFGGQRQGGGGQRPSGTRPSGPGQQRQGRPGRKRGR